MIVFVGIHNKEDMMPLDILSKTGKIISKIEKQLEIKVLRTNLYDLDRMPTGNEIDHEPVKWWHRNYMVELGDVIVLLGRYVHDNFHYPNDGYRYVKLPHPASIFHTSKKESDYVDMAVRKINEAI